MTRRKRNGRPRASRAAAATNNLVTSECPQPTALLRVPARLLPASARRTLPALVVDPCPFCPTGGPHLHRGHGGLRRAGCGRGEYVIVAVPALERGKRGAA